MSERIPKSRAVRAASAKLPIRGDRALRENLEFVADSLVEAYLLGAHEAQGAIVSRIAALKGKP